MEAIIDPHLLFTFTSLCVSSPSPVASKLYGFNVSIIIFVFVSYCIVFLHPNDLQIPPTVVQYGPHSHTSFPVLKPFLKPFSTPLHTFSNPFQPLSIPSQTFFNLSFLTSFNFKTPVSILPYSNPSSLTIPSPSPILKPPFPPPLFPYHLSSLPSPTPPPPPPLPHHPSPITPPPPYLHHHPSPTTPPPPPLLRNPSVVGVSSLGYDHTDFLGDTLAEIAWNKAGIFKVFGHFIKLI